MINLPTDRDITAEDLKSCTPEELDEICRKARKKIRANKVDAFVQNTGMALILLIWGLIPAAIAFIVAAIVFTAFWGCVAGIGLYVLIFIAGMWWFNL